MVAIFASATALLTPEFVGSFEPERLAAKFVQVEKETGVKFNKTNNTFNIVGHWDAIQIAHKSLRKFVQTLEKCPPPASYEYEEPPPPEAPLVVFPPVKADSTDAGAGERVIPIKGNPKRGRQSSSDPAKPSPLPEPVVYFQYQDRSYMSEEVINLDALLDAFEDNLPDTIKVKKEDLKKILEKNTENMGRPLEKRKAYIQAQAEAKAKEEQQLLQQQQTLQEQHEQQQQLQQQQQHEQLHQQHLLQHQQQVHEVLQQPHQQARDLQQLHQSGHDLPQQHQSGHDLQQPHQSGHDLQQPHQQAHGIQQPHQSGHEVLQQPHQSGHDIQQPHQSGHDLQQPHQSSHDLNQHHQQAHGIQHQHQQIHGIQHQPGHELQQHHHHQQMQHQQPFQETTHLNGELAGIPEHIPVVETTREEMEAIDSAQASIEQALENAVANMHNNDQEDAISLSNSAADLSKTTGILLTPPSDAINSWVGNKFPSVITAGAVDETQDKTVIKNEIPSSDNDFGGDTDDDLSYMEHPTAAPEPEPAPERPKSPEYTIETPVAKPKGKGTKRTRKAKDKTVKSDGSETAVPISKDQTGQTVSGQTVETVGSVTESTVKPRSTRKSKPPKQAASLEGEEDMIEEESPPPKKKATRVRKVTTAKKQSKPSKKSSTNKNTTADNSLPVDNDTAATDVAERADNPDQPPLKIKIRQLRNPQPKQSRKLRQSRVEWDEPSKLGRPKSNKMYKCTECDYTSQKRTRWTEHMGRVHGLLTEKDLERQKKSQFPCDTCDKSFIFEKDLKRHKKIVHTTVSHFCGICQKSYKSKYVYDKHVATHKEGYIRNMFICQICKREFTTKFSLANHIKTAHLGIQKTYLCPTCGKSFNQIRSYRQHANVHAGIKPYVCEICGKGFTYDSSLKDHRYMHDNIRRFSCNKCGKAFRQRTSLQIHLKVHKETKDHICSSCGKGFTQKQSLIRHERIHTGDKPYTCMMCQKTFSDYAVIRRHMMMSHKKDKDEWNQFIISDVKRKSDHYIPGGPGYQSRSRNANNKSYVKAVDANVIIPREDAPPPGTGIDLTPLDQHAPAEPETSATTPQPVVTQNEETVYRKKEVIEQPLPTMDGRIQNMFGGGTIYGTATILPQQQLIMTSGTKMVPNTSDHHQLTAVPINYSIPPGCVAAIPSTSPESQIDDSIVNSFLKNDGYRQVRPQQQKDMFTPVLAPLSAVAPVSDTQRTAVPFSTTPVTTEAILSQAAGLAPWGYAGFPAYLNNFNPANFAQFQGHQN